ncbi:MAG: PD40 domain-containing protein [Anaerolineae bacterium]|nr:PD40 domain-containing protein [Anaerolineae bacterium]
MSHIFISYSKKDIDFARRLRELLQAQGLVVWMDEKQIAPSARWWPTIKQNIARASAMIVIMSPNSEESEWVEREILVAEDPDNRKTIFPVLLAGKVWARLGNLQATMLTPDVSALPPEFIEALKTAQSSYVKRTTTTTDLRRQTNTMRSSALVPPTRSRVSNALLIAIVAVSLLGLGILGTAWLRRDTNQTATPPPQQTLTPTSVAQAKTATPTPTTSPPINTPELSTLMGGGTGVIAFSRDGELYLANIDGTGEKLIYSDPGADAAVPVWSPDGKRIAFRRDPKESPEIANADIFTINVDGSNLQQLTTLNADISSPTWSPDGLYLAFRAGVGSGNREIMVLKLDDLTKPAVNLTGNAAQDLTPIWSADGKYIYFSTQRPAATYSIFRMNADGSGVTQIINNGFNNYQPDLSSNGSSLAYSSSISRDNGRGIFVATSTGKSVQLLFKDGKINQAPVFSPDGQWLLFFATPAAGQKSAPSMIYRLPVAGGAPTFVINGEFPAWQPLASTN